MKKFLFFWIACFTSQMMTAQIGIAKYALALEDNNFVGSIWEPTGTVNYTENNGVGIYGLVISLHTSDDYLDIFEGHKVSIEFTDGTREIVDVKAAPTSLLNKTIDYKVIHIFQRRVLIYPNYDNLIQKDIKRFVIQRTNGKVWIIDTKPRRAKKLRKELITSMNEAVNSYKVKLSNDNYFGEATTEKIGAKEPIDDVLDESTTKKAEVEASIDNNSNETNKEKAKWTFFINKDGLFRPFDETIDINPTFTQTDDCPKGTFCYHRSCLGYLEAEVIMYYNDFFDFVALNAFNNEIIFVTPSDMTKKTLSMQEVMDHLDGYVPNESEFSRNLKRGVEGKSIRQSFVEESLKKTATDGVIVDEAHGFVYTFSNGLMTKYHSISGLSNDALSIKNDFPQIFSRIQKNAQIHYGNTQLATEYINGQCKYFTIINLNYLKNATNPAINYNYAMLYSIYNEGVNLDEFTFLVPEAELSSSVNNYIFMSYGSYMFTFKDKVLVKQ